MPHRRSVQAQQRRYAKKLVQKTAFKDDILCESVCRLTSIEIAERLRQQFNTVLLSATNFEPGEILTDTRGRGTLQQIAGSIK